ncbi:MAG: MFS transporter [Lentisphaerae bacterium]|nr:MFS transporter [Lentisphaerota bacterium]MBE6389156.1 MFS transporter [Lentisphaerota bacterium]
MAFSKAQKSWLAYDPALSAYAMIVRTVAAPLFLATYAQGVLSEAQSTEYWGYTCSIAGLAAGAISVFSGPKIDAGNKKVLTVALFTLTGVLSTLAYTAIFCIKNSLLIPYIIIGISFSGIISFMGANSFYDSLLLNITTRKERDTVSSWGFALGYAGALISFLCCLPLMSIAGGKYFFPGAFIIAALWWGLGSLPLLKNVREKTVVAADRIKLTDTLRFICKEKNILLFLLAYFLYIDGVGTIMMQAALIAKGLQLSNSKIMLTILALQIIGMPFTLLFGFLAKIFSAKKMILTAISIYIVIAMLVTIMSFCPAAEIRVWLFYAAAGAIGMVQGGIQSLSRSVFSMIIPAGRAAELFAVYNIFGRFTTIIGPLVMIPFAVHLWGKAELGISLMILPFACGAFLLTKVKVPEN